MPFANLITPRNVAGVIKVNESLIVFGGMGTIRGRKQLLKSIERLRPDNIFEELNFVDP